MGYSSRSQLCPPSWVTLGKALGFSELGHKAGEVVAPIRGTGVQSPAGQAHKCGVALGWASG